MYENASKLPQMLRVENKLNERSLRYVCIALFWCLWVFGGGLEPFKRILFSGGLLPLKRNDFFGNKTARK